MCKEEGLNGFCNFARIFSVDFVANELIHFLVVVVVVGFHNGGIDMRIPFLLRVCFCCAERSYVSGLRMVANEGKRSF